MITHVVLFKLRDPDADAAPLIDRMRALPDTIPQIRRYEVGRDVSGSDRSFDVGLVSQFDSLDDLEAYRVHPDHQALVAHLDTVRTDTVVVDYEA